MEGEINIEKVCRICLRESDTLISIFCDDLQQKVKVSNMIVACSQSKIFEDDGMPQHICVKCLQMCRTSYNFKQSAEESYEKLLVYIRYIRTGGQLDQEEPLPASDKMTQTDEFTFYPCELCSEKFINFEDLKKHRMEHSKNGDLYQCQHCEKIYSRLYHLRRHIGISHPKFGLPKAVLNISRCEDCGVEFTRRDHLRRHMLTKHDKVLETSRHSDDFIEDDADSDDGEEEEEEEEMDEEEDSFNDDVDEEHLQVEADIVVESENLKFENLEYLNDEAIEFLVDVKAEQDVAADIKDEILKHGQNYAPLENIKTEYGDEIDGNSEERNKEIPMPSVTMTKKKPIRNRENRCEICQKTFSRNTHLKRHIMTHTQEKPHKCDECGKAFARVDHLNNHKIYHSSIRPFDCDICKRKFKRTEDLRRHRETRHRDKPLVEAKTEICPICKKGFTTQKYLTHHMRLHSGNRIYTCKNCPEEFNDRTLLNEHSQKMHAHEKPFLCSECGLRFVRNDYLVIHMRRHKGEKPYKCKYCGKGFPRATDLTVHERYHTGTKTHLCTTCGKSFHRAYNLLVHTRVHTGERPYKCPHCTKSFAQGNDLKSHIRRHTGERYKCDICGDGFIQGYHLTQHKRNVHNIDAQSHIKRLEKFITPMQQHHQVLLQQHQHHLEDLQKQQQEYYNMQSIDGLQLRDQNLEKQIVDTQKQITDIEQMLIMEQQQMDEQQQSIEGKNMLTNSINQITLVEQCSSQELDLYPKIKIQEHYGN